MEKSILEIVIDIISYIIDYIFNIKLFDVPLLIFYIMIVAGIGYCGALILIGVPCSIWEACAKKKIREDIERKAITVVAICLAIAVIMLIVHKKIT